MAGVEEGGGVVAFAGVAAAVVSVGSSEVCEKIFYTTLPLF